VAGVGAAHVVSGPGEMGRYRGVLAAAPACMSYYGTGRFDPTYAKPSAHWEVW
jgi:hypothetical protein